MRVIVWGINFAPELTGIAPYNVALCEFLQARGDDVEMVTTFAYYPAWRKRTGESTSAFPHRHDQRRARLSLLAFCPAEAPASSTLRAEDEYRKIARHPTGGRNSFHL